jgi:hypothetical protein
VLLGQRPLVVGYEVGARLDAVVTEVSSPQWSRRAARWSDFPSAQPL